MNPIPSTEHFDYDTVSKRNAQLMVVYLKATLLSGGAEPSEAVQQEIAERIQQSMTDQLLLLAEVRRLYEVLENFKRTHMPLPGVPGAPVLCEGCSLHGAQVPWPCETYTQAGKALPERRP